MFVGAVECMHVSFGCMFLKIKVCVCFGMHAHFVCMCVCPCAHVCLLASYRCHLKQMEEQLRSNSNNYTNKMFMVHTKSGPYVTDG